MKSEIDNITKYYTKNKKELVTDVLLETKRIVTKLTVQEIYDKMIYYHLFTWDIADVVNAHKDINFMIKNLGLFNPSKVKRLKLDSIIYIYSDNPIIN